DDDPEEAAALYEEVLARDPGYLRALHGLGLARVAAGDPAGAEPPLRRILERDRGYADRQAWRDLGDALRRAGALDAAVAVLEERVRGDPRLRHATALAWALVSAGRPGDAADALRSALEHYRHAPGHVRRFARRDAREANRLLASLEAAPA